MISTRRWVQLGRGALVVAATVSIVAPLPSGAQEDDSGSDQAGRAGSAQIELDVDVLRGDTVDVSSALGDLASNVEAQQAALDAAEAAANDAQAALDVANLLVAEAQARLDDLAKLTDELVIEAYVNPPAEAGLDALSAESLTDLTVKQSILNTQASGHAHLLDQFQAAQQQVEIEKAAREEAAHEAEGRKSDAEAALADLRSAVSQQVQFIAEVERRLSQRLSEAAALADLDPELAAQLMAREAELAQVVSQLQEEARAEAAQELAAQLAAQAEAQRGCCTIKQPPGGLASVDCPSGGSITVAGDIAPSVQRLVDDAAAAGISMCGNGYRDPQEQIALRRAHCGSSTYAIYQAPASYCSPPTAQPGSSMHEQGLAIDFTCAGGGTVSWGDSCHDWLRAHAAEYGLYPLSSEPWHWSVNGD